MMKRHVVLGLLAICGLALCWLSPATAYAQEKKAKAARGGKTSRAGKAADPSGLWKWTRASTSGGQAREYTLKLQRLDGKLSGTLTGGGRSGGPGMSTPITNPKFGKGVLSFTVKSERGGQTRISKYNGKVGGDKITGKIEMGNGETTRTADWNAKRAGKQSATVIRDMEHEPDVIFVPTPQKAVDKMLELAQVKKGDVLYDLGCGDGRIPVTAAKKIGCTAFGFDIDPTRIKESLDNVEKNNVGELVTIEQKDIFTLDLSKANVVTLYLLPSLNVRLIPQLDKLKPGSRIVSHDFDMEGVTPDQVVEVTDDEDQETHTIYLWTAPLKKNAEAKPAK